MSEAPGEEENLSCATPLSEEPTVHLVVQRCESARLLVDNVDQWVEVGRGLVVYISFAKGATEAAVRRAARTVLQVPLVTEGHWGDGTAPCSVLTRCAHGAPCAVLVVPQASLTSKVKGKCLNYRKQLEKDSSEALYKLFVESLTTVAQETLNPPPRKIRKPEAPPEPPDVFFRTGQFAGCYSQFDKRGVPTCDGKGEALSKSQVKKVERLYHLQVDKYARYAGRAQGAERRTAPSAEDDEPDDHLEVSDGEGHHPLHPLKAKEFETASSMQMQPTQSRGHAGVSKAYDSTNLRQPQVEPISKCVLPQVVAGTFGNRQGLHLTAECGPFTHVFTF